MIQRPIVCLLGMASAAMLVGCATARHVEMRPDGGVVAIPANSNAWPYYHRDKAIALIERDAPNGYEIVHEEEAVARKVTHVTTHRKAQPAPALVLHGAETS